MSNPKNKPVPYDYENSSPMSHDEATTSNAVELYVLREMSPAQELAFEEHYFECQECARAVAIEQALIENMEARRAAAPEPSWRRWSQRLAFPVLAPLTAALLGLVSFQGFQTIPSLKSQLAQLSMPEPNTVIIAHEVQMGTLDGETVKTPSATIEFNLPADASPSPFYRVELLGEGRPPISKVVPAPAEGPHLSLHVTRQTIGPGSYNVMVYGLATQDSPNGPQIGQYHFNIKQGD